jgi:very-short-patch-repair endonuclease
MDDGQFERYLEGAARDLQKRAGLWESPIEKSLGIELFKSANTFLGFTTVCRVESLREAAEILCSTNLDVGKEPFVCIFTQQKIDRYRVDMAMFYKNGSPRHIHKCIVECDGHDFHERTKEQAARDRMKDRQLQRLGYRVLRFTGSEIYQDATGCALEVVEHIKGAK